MFSKVVSGTTLEAQITVFTNMKKFLVALFALNIGISTAQTFTIPAEKQPYYDIYEWKGIGAVLLSRDPTLNQQQIKLTGIKEGSNSDWSSSINPIGKELFFISEDGGKYCYFLEQLQPENGKVFLHQLTSSGIVKVNKLDMTMAVKKLGDYLPSDLEVIDIVCTQRALVYLFRHENKAEKKVSTIAVTVTHSNLLSYATLVAEHVGSSSKVEDLVSWYIAGEKGDNIIFAARTNVGKTSGWGVKEFDPKGKLVNGFEISGSDVNFIEHTRVGFGRRGSALMNKVSPKEKGTLLFANGNYYVGGVEVSGNTASLNTYVWKENKFEKAGTSTIGSYNVKKELSVGFFPLSEGIGWYVKNTLQEGHTHLFNNPVGFVSGTVSQTMTNPSRLLTDQFPTNFVASFPTQWLVFSTKQLPAAGSVTFEYIKK
jgi:hypothetical protein